MHTSNTEQNSKDNSMEWLSKILDDFMYNATPVNLNYLKGKRETEQAIRSHLLADVMRVLDIMNPRTIDNGNEAYERVKGGAREFRAGYDIATRQVHQAFNELLGGDK